MHWYHKIHPIVYLTTFFAILVCGETNAIPLSFLKTTAGNQRDIQWNLLDDGFVEVYYDKNSSQLAESVQESIWSAYPHLKNILGVKLDKVTLILGDRDNGPGFANPVSQNIEAQILSSRTQAFFQHELVHRMMYVHNDFHIGPLGRIFSLAMMPTWWIEGLAEYLTESVGEVEIEGFMREMALNDHWPSWERLHALYNADGDSNLRGYVVSGRFFGWILSRSNEKDLAKIQEQIAWRTVTPPFYNASDKWLVEHVGKTGKELYDEFKQEQTAEWKKYVGDMPRLHNSEIENVQTDTPPDFKDILSQIMTFSTRSDPYFVERIVPVGDDVYMVKAYVHANTQVLLYRAKEKKLDLIKDYTFSEQVEVLAAAKENSESYCFFAKVTDKNIDSLIEKVCSDKTSHVLFPKEKLKIHDAYVLRDGTLRILATWGRVQGLYDVQGETITPIAAFPEWIELIERRKSNDSEISALVYDKGEYKSRKMDVAKLKKNFADWQTKQDSASPFLKMQPYEHDIEPFVKYDVKPQAQAANDLPQRKSEPYMGEAPYSYQFLFAYPYPLPSFLGGPSINLVAMPLVDKMERYRVQAIGGYHFDLDVAYGALTYVNNRLFDSFAVSLFGMPIFNGNYEITTVDSLGQPVNTTTYSNYLEQRGLSVSLGYILWPGRVTFQGLASLTQLRPYPNLTSAPETIGPQHSDLLSTRGVLSFHFGKKAQLSLGGGKFDGVGDATTTRGINTGTLDYYNLNAKLTAGVTFSQQNLTFNGKISTTQGNNSLYLREYYSPYQDHSEDSVRLLSDINFFILGDGNFSSIRMGDYSYFYGLNYDFPLAKNFESLLLISYADDLRGFFNVTQGGVWAAGRHDARPPVTSATGGVSLRLDIKGFQLFPSLGYTQLLEEGGYRLMMQIKFTDLI